MADTIRVVLVEGKLFVHEGKAWLSNDDGTPDEIEVGDTIDIFEERTSRYIERPAPFGRVAREFRRFVSEWEPVDD